MESNSIYILAREFGKSGSIIYEEKDQPDKIQKLFSYLNSECLTIETDVEVVLIKGIENYKEYYPLKYIDNSREFTTKVLDMININN